MQGTSGPEKEMEEDKQEGLSFAQNWFQGKPKPKNRMNEEKIKWKF